MESADRKLVRFLPSLGLAGYWLVNKAGRSSLAP